MKTPSDKFCIVLAMAWDTDQLTKYSSLSTACAFFQMTGCRFLSWVDIASWTLVKHLDIPAAWLHITVCSLAALSQQLKISWLKVWEDGAAGKLRWATLLNALFNFAGSGDQEHTVEISESFLSVCMSYHLDDLDGLTNWSLRSPAMSVFLGG